MATNVEQMWDVEWLTATNRSFVLLPCSTQLWRMKFSGYIIWNSLSFCILPTSTHIVTIFPFLLHYFNKSFYRLDVSPCSVALDLVVSPAGLALLPHLPKLMSTEYRKHLMSPLRYQDIPGLAPPSGKEYFPLGSVAEKRPLPTLAGTIHKGHPHQGERGEGVAQKQL